MAAEGEKYFTQYICATKENNFTAHYVIYQKSPLQLANKTKYKRFANASREKAKLERLASDPGAGA